MIVFATTGRLILRRPREADIDPLVRSWSHPEMTRHVEKKPDVRAFLTKMVADMQVKEPGDQEPGGPWFQFVAERRSDGTLVGDLGVGFGNPGPRQVEFGYRILPAFQRQGYAREALAALIDLLAERYGIHRFVAVAAAANEASTALLRSLGFRQEGHLRQSFLCDGEWLDDEYHALLASEWRTRDP